MYGFGMTDFSLYDRFRNQGTVSEPDGIPDPRYALPSTVHWMRAYAVLIKDEALDFQKSDDFYRSIQKASLTAQQENSVFEHLLLAVHQLAALRAMSQSPAQADIARAASVAWYYGIYAAVTAMVAAQDGSVQDNHTKTANAWDRQFVAQSKVPHPFDLRVSTLVKKKAEIEIDALRRGPKANLVHQPVTVDDAHQAICGYLSGTRGWWAWRLEEEIKLGKEFRQLGLSNFRTKQAQELRDARLSKQCISFAHQAIRFRGKANYREALYLAHGRSVETVVSDFAGDMADVLEAFTALTGAYCFRRLGPRLCNGFLADLDRNRSFSIDPHDIWS
jgi:hypothetical protein